MASRSRRRHLAIVVGAYALSRVVMFAGGVRFRDAALGRVHLADRVALAEHPFGAFTSLHIQPPLFNFFVGAVLRWSPFPSTFSFQVAYLAMGLATTAMLWMLLDDFASRRWITTVVVILVAWNPLFIRNESVLTYELPVTFLLVATVWCAHRYLQRPDLGRFVMVLAVLVAGVLTRAALNPLWFVAAVVVLLVLRRPVASRRAVAGVIVVAVLAIGLPIMHNAARFHTIGLSSYSGMNLQRITVLQLPRARLDALIAQGKLSGGAGVVPFSSYDAYAPFFPRCSPPEDDLFLGPVLKSDRGGTNLNSVCYLPVYLQARHDAVSVLRNDPAVYVRSVGIASLLYTAWGTYFAAPRSTWWESWSRVYEPLMSTVSVHYPFDASDPQPYARKLDGIAQVQPISLTVVFALLYVLGAGVVGAASLLRRRGDSNRATRVFVAFLVAGLTVVSVTLDIYENARFREPLDPLLLGFFFVWLLGAVTDGVGRVRAGRRRGAETAAVGR